MKIQWWKSQDSYISRLFLLKVSKNDATTRSGKIRFKLVRESSLFDILTLGCLQEISVEMSSKQLDIDIWGFYGGTSGKELACQCRRYNGHGFDPWVWSLGQEDPLKEMTTHSNILAWKIPWTKKPEGYSPWDPKKLDTTEATEHPCKM